MCGLFGYVGSKNAYNEVYDGLINLQYRGYDSCGIAYLPSLNKNANYKVIKRVGDVKNLKQIKTKNNIAFGHTRWATTGKVNKINAHPQISCDGRILVVHNGIITNYADIKKELINKGLKFKSQTDTEVVANYISTLKEIDEEIKDIFNVFEGSFSLIIACCESLYLIKNESPLNILKNDDGIYISSDISSLPSGKLYSLKDKEIIKIHNEQIIPINCDISFSIYNNNLLMATNGNFNHYMLKEIYDTPNAIKSTFNRIKDLNFNFIFKFKKIVMLGCGTAYNSCLIGKFLLDKLKNYSIECEVASNYDLNHENLTEILHVIVSQSGETADCIEIAKKIRNNGGCVAVITNNESSVLTKYANYVIPIVAGKEIAVASTKTFVCQIFTFIYIYSILNNKPISDVENVANKLNEYINSCDVLMMAKKLKKQNRVIMIGQGIDYLILKEAALKIREIDYIFTLPIIAKELKHGSIALINKKTKVIAFESSVNSNLDETKQEIFSRKGKLIEISLKTLNIDEIYKPIFSIIPFQLLSYKIAILNGHNPDMPRNLAKSVTVR